MGCNNSKGSSPKGAKEAGESDTGTAKEDKLKFLAKVQLFKRLPPEELPKLAEVAQEKTFQQGEVIMKQGDDGSEFFVIKSGIAEVSVDGNVVAKVKDGDFFGEGSLLKSQPRAATIKCVASIQALMITRDKFFELGLPEKVEFPKRGAVAGGNNKDIQIQPPSPKSNSDSEFIAKALMNNANLQAMYSLTQPLCMQLAERMWLENVDAGTEIIKEGDISADYFYVVSDGSFMICKNEGQSAEAQGANQVGTVGKGGSFGELALMYLAPRAATVKANEAAKVWVIDRGQFKKILLDKASSGDSQKLLKFLNEVEIFSALKNDEKVTLSNVMQSMRFSKDEEVFSQGEPGDNFYILTEGQVAIIKDGKQINKLAASETNFQYFGELALMNNAPRSATIKVLSEEATALIIDKISFEMSLGSLEALKKRGQNGTAMITKAVAPGATDTKRFGTIKRKDLKILGLLGCGGFGAVQMVEHSETGETYALKALSKGYVIKTGMQDSVMSEKNVQLMADSPFVVKLMETYNGEQSLYFLLELCLGGELYATYNKKNLWGKYDCARFYVAGTVFAFDHLHGKKILFRDLKPENLLLNSYGRVKLTDMGLAKVCPGKTYTTCGTPDYFAPELVASKGHTRAVDWWTLGILSFELLAGHPPFESASPMAIFAKVTKGINKVNFPKACKEKGAEKYIKALCCAKPEERLAMKKGGIQNIKNDPWYSGFDWDGMYALSNKVPFKPVVKSKKDNANFSARKEDMPPQVPYKDPKTGWDKDFATST